MKEDDGELQNEVTVQEESNNSKLPEVGSGVIIKRKPQTSPKRWSLMTKTYKVTMYQG